MILESFCFLQKQIPYFRILLLFREFLLLNMLVRISTFKFSNQTKADAFSELYKNTLMEKYIKILKSLNYLVLDQVKEKLLVLLSINL